MPVQRLPSSHMVVFGAGGASRAICVELALAGATRITVVNRGRGRGEELVRMLGDRTSAEADFQPALRTLRRRIRRARLAGMLAMRILSTRTLGQANSMACFTCNLFARG